MEQTNMNKLTVKSILMMAITLIATSLASGFPSTGNEWIILSITIAGTLLGYISQSIVLPATSLLGDLNLRDLVKGILVAVSNFLASLAASWTTTQTIDWADAGKSAAAVIVMYFIKQLASKPSGVPPVK